MGNLSNNQDYHEFLSSEEIISFLVSRFEDYSTEIVAKIKI